MKIQIDGIMVERPSLEDACARCGEIMTQMVQEHVVIRSCTAKGCGYESKTVTGETKLRHAQSIGSYRPFQR